MPENRENIKPVRRKTTEERLAELRDTFSDEVPAEIIHSDYQNNRFKVRKNWWQGVIANLDVLLTDGKITDPQLQQETNQFINDYTAPGFSGDHLTTAADITKANHLIDRVLGREKPKTAPS